MTRRLVDSSMWQNEKFATLPAMARLLQIGMINHADDQGRGKAHPSLLRAQVFPYDDVTLSDVLDWLRLIETNGTIMLYSADGKDYYQMCNWWEYQAHQYAMPSDYPKPEGWRDRVRKTFTKGQIVTCNWVLSNGTRSPDTCDEQGHLIQVNNQVNIQDKDKDKDEDHGGPTPPPEPTFAERNGNGYFGMSVPTNYEKLQIDDAIREAAKAGVSQEAFVAMYNALIDGVGWRGVVDTGRTKKGQFAREDTLTLIGMGMAKNAQQVSLLVEAFKAAHPKSKVDPRAIVDYASQLKQEGKAPSPTANGTVPNFDFSALVGG